MALHWHIKKIAIDFKGFYMFMTAMRVKNNDFSQKSDEDGLKRSLSYTNQVPITQSRIEKLDRIQKNLV